MRIYKNSRPYQILKYLALGSGLLLLSSIAPLQGTQLIKLGIKSYIYKKRFAREKFLRDLKNLQKRGLIDIKQVDGDTTEVTITKNGKEKVLRYQLDDMQLKPMPQWDRKWRLVIFDIPHFQKKARDAFRQKLTDLKFYPLQKSVFITPHPCENEIDFIASIFNVRKNILVLYANKFEGEEKLKHRFGV